MTRILALSFCLALAPLAAFSEEEAGQERVLGMSIVGDHESPKSLVIVPWKSADLGLSLDVSRIADDGRGAVDRDVFRRELAYHRIRAAAHTPDVAAGR